MLADIKQLLADFVRVSVLAGVPISEHQIRHELLRVLHESSKLPRGSCAVYVFSLTNDGSIVLKVGKAGPKSAARFESQHYFPRSCNSNLSKSIIARKGRWSTLGISIVGETTIGNWLRTNTDCDYFFLNAIPPVINLLEVFCNADCGLSSRVRPRQSVFCSVLECTEKRRRRGVCHLLGETLAL